MKLLALVESPDHVCCRYRIRAFRPHLAEAGWSLTCEGLDRGAFFRSSSLRRASRFDAVILQRKLLPLAIACAAPRIAPSRLRLRRRGPVPRFVRQRGPQSRWRSRRFAQTVRAADTVVAGNDFLADVHCEPGPGSNEST